MRVARAKLVARIGFKSGKMLASGFMESGSAFVGGCVFGGPAVYVCVFHCIPAAGSLCVFQQRRSKIILTLLGRNHGIRPWNGVFASLEGLAVGIDQRVFRLHVGEGLEWCGEAHLAGQRILAVVACLGAEGKFNAMAL